MIQKKKSDWSSIDTLEDLQREQRRLKAVIRVQEKELRGRVKELPGELVYAGINAVVPSFLSGKITTSTLGFIKTFINKAFTNKEGGEDNGKLMGAVKKVGIFALAKIAFNAFMRKK